MARPALRLVSCVFVAAALALPSAAPMADPEGHDSAEPAGLAPPAPLDRNGDRVVSRDEFLRFRLTLVFGPDQDRAHWEAAARLAFAACDLDGNGELDAAELKHHPECGF